MNDRVYKWFVVCTPQAIRIAKFHPKYPIKQTFWLGRLHVFKNPPPNPSPKCQESWKATVEVNEKLITIWRGEKLNERRKKEGKVQSSDYFGNCYLMTGQGVRRGLGNIIFVCLLNEECEQPCMNIPFSLTFYLSGVLQFRFIKR